MMTKKSAVWVVAAAVAVLTTGCGPRSAKEFSGTYAGTNSGTHQSVQTNKDGSTTTKSENTASPSSEVTFTAPDATTITPSAPNSGSNGQSPFGDITFKQSGANDTVFDVVPTTTTTTANGGTSVFKVESGSVTFTGVDVAMSLVMSISYSEGNPDGSNYQSKDTYSGTFTGTKK